MNKRNDNKYYIYLYFNNKLLICIFFKAYFENYFKCIKLCIIEKDS